MHQRRLEVYSIDFTSQLEANFGCDEFVITYRLGESRVKYIQYYYDALPRFEYTVKKSGRRGYIRCEYVLLNKYEIDEILHHDGGDISDNLHQKLINLCSIVEAVYNDFANTRMNPIDIVELYRPINVSIKSAASKKQLL